MPKAFTPNSPKRMSISEASLSLGVSRTTLRKWLDKGCPQHNDGTVNAWDVVSWKLIQDIESTGSPLAEAMSQHPVDGYAEELADNAIDDGVSDLGPPTSQTELKERIELIRERKLLARQKRLEHDRQLLCREVVRDGIVRWASLVKAAAERIERRSGAGVADPLNEAMEAFERELLHFEDVVDGQGENVQPEQ